MTISREQLFNDLMQAYEDTKRHKSKRYYVRNFEKHKLRNLVKLCDEIYERKYIQQPMNCFIFAPDYSNRREVFAAQFRDKVVQHLLYNYLYPIFDKTFIYDSYSCRKGKGTLFGIKRFIHHSRSESNNYKETCYALKIDIKGYFVHINRQKLLDVVLSELNKVKHKYDNYLDFDLIEYLCREIILFDPVKNCNKLFTEEQIQKIPKRKLLFYSPEGHGLPIGNITSQLFSNVFLNLLDQYVKRELKAKHYGRYVDDAYIISKDKEYLKFCIGKITNFVTTNLNLEIQTNKVQIKDIKYGIEFLGAYIKPYREYISNKTIRRIKLKLKTTENTSPEQKLSKMRSYFGILKHFRTKKIKTDLFMNYF